MGIGVISISTSAKIDPAPQPGPPFTSDSANNGLSVDGVSGKIVLGNDENDLAAPAALLSNREIVTEDAVLNQFQIILNAIQSFVKTTLTGQAIRIESAVDSTSMSIFVGGTGQGMQTEIHADVGDFSVSTITSTTGVSGGSTIGCISGISGSATVIARAGDGGTSLIQAATSSAGFSTLAFGNGTDALTLEASTIQPGRVSFRVRGLFTTMAINTTTLCTMVQSTNSAAFNGATLQVSGTHTYRKFPQSQAAGTYNLDRDTDSAKVFRNSGALVIAMANMVGANFREGFFFDALVNDASGITIDATAGVTIRFGGLATSAGGTIFSTEVGAYIRVQIIDSTTYNVCFSVGLWNIT